MGFRVWGLGFRAPRPRFLWLTDFGIFLRSGAPSFDGAPFWTMARGPVGLGFRVWGLGFRVWGLGFRVWGLGFKV